MNNLKAELEDLLVKKLLAILRANFRLYYEYELTTAVISYVGHLQQFS